MRLKIALTINLYLFAGLVVSAQIDLIGRVVDDINGEFLQHVKLYFEKQSEFTFTDKGGYFHIKKPAIIEAVLVFELKGYATLRMPVKFELSLKQLNLGSVTLSRIEDQNVRNDWIEQNELELESDHYEVENFTGILNAGKDLFSRTVAYDFGSNFFRPRFLGTDHGTVMLNSVPMNKVYSGRPEWSNWGGLNDALRHQENYAQMQSSTYYLGGLSHSINMISRASQQKKGLKLSMALSNKNYQSRLMITYSSGTLKNGWAYMLSGSLRYADEGYRSGTDYRAYSFLASFDKQLGKKNHVNTTLIYAFNAKGKSSPMTQEVFELKNIAYNSYWGYQQSQMRNSREKRILEPIFQVNHEFKVNDKTRIYNHFTYQFGVISSSRLDYGGGRFLKNSQALIGGGTNPDPSYYQKLPSYFLRDSLNPDYGRAYLAEKEFKEQGQIKWNELYEANMNSLNDNHAVYALYNDEQDGSTMALSTSFSTHIGNHFSMNGAISFKANSSENYAKMYDLLGGEGYLDVDLYADNITKAQNNLQDPERVVYEQERFRYNYQLQSKEASIFLKSTYSTKRTDVYFGAQYFSIVYQRNGLYENGFFPGSLSFGKSKKIDFQPFALKTGFSHKFNGRHIVIVNVNYLEKAPVLNNVFSNVRVSNEVVNGLKKGTNMGFDLKYVWRHPHFKTHISGYYLLLTDESKISFYYADGLTGLENSASSAYVQEVLTGIDRRNMGLEFSVEIPLFSNVKFKGVAAIGNSVYTSNPELYLNSNTFNESLNLGKSFLKGYYSTGGPQQAFSIGFEYSSPKYWWISGSLNYFDKSYISVASITRTKNFFLDTDGLPIHELDSEIAKSLLRQEYLPSYTNLNLVGGKSWKINDWYLGLFAAINNLSNSIYKTGGFEQSRTANYLTMKEDKTRDKPLFGPKYWFGFGTTFFTSFYIRL